MTILWKSLTFVSSGASHTYSCGPANIQHAIARAMREDKKELEQYIIMARNCLMAVAKYCNKKESIKYHRQSSIIGPVISFDIGRCYKEKGNAHVNFSKPPRGHTSQKMGSVASQMAEFWPWTFSAIGLEKLT